MDGTDWGVLGAAAGGIALVNWYFLFGKRTALASIAASGVQQVTIRVEGGYDPSIVEVAAGRPVQLVFDRRENNPCSEEVVIGALGIRRDLPAFERTAVEFTPAKAGRYDFTCGMGMLHGTLVVKEERHGSL
jgi:plastocyanin domain-containing protein